MTDSAELRIHEIYASLQGESSLAGFPCVLVRLARCNLRCTWCDTPEAFNSGTKMAVDDVFAQAMSYQLPQILITGGEPLLQDEVLPLMKRFCDAGKTVLIETSGERDISQVDPRVHRIMDFKAPGSGESEKNRWSNVSLLTRNDEAKFVLSDRKDYEWAKGVMREQDLAARVRVIHLSPVWGLLEPRQLAQWILDDKLNVHLQLQLHKVIWGGDAKHV